MNFIFEDIDTEIPEDIFMRPDGVFCTSDGTDFIPVSPSVLKKLEREYEKLQRLVLAAAEGLDLKAAEEQDRLRHLLADRQNGSTTTPQGRSLEGDKFTSNLAGDKKRALLDRTYFHGKDSDALSKVLLEILHNVIDNEILPDNDEKPDPKILRTKSYQRPDLYHDFGRDVLLKGQVRKHYDPDEDEEDEEEELEIIKPLSLVYIDRSGSFSSYGKLKLADDITTLLKSAEFLGKMDLSIRYFTEHVYLSDPGVGGGTNLRRVLLDIGPVIAGRLANVIIITDDDTSADNGTDSIPINGSVFLIFADAKPSGLARNFDLLNDSILKEFSFENI